MCDRRSSARPGGVDGRLAAGKHQPDAVAAAVIAFDVLFQAAGARMTVAAPVGVVDGRASTRGGFADRLGTRRPVVEALVAEAAAKARAAASDDTGTGRLRFA